jgi:hypothetical protein
VCGFAPLSFDRFAFVGARSLEVLKLRTRLRRAGTLEVTKPITMEPAKHNGRSKKSPQSRSRLGVVDEDLLL